MDDNSSRNELEARLPALRPRLHRYCARMTGSVIDGEDVLQDALADAHRALAQGAVVEDMERWLFRIARNAALDHLRQRARRNAMFVEDADMATIEDPIASAEQRLAAAASLRTFMHLSLVQRSTVILVDVLGLSLKEAADVMEATVAAIKAALHRGRTRLSALAAEPDEAPAPTLSADEERRLRHYVDRFNARDFDAIRALVAEDVQVDLVARTRLRGKAAVSTYFGNYARATDWALSPGFVDGRPAILVCRPDAAAQAPVSFMLVDWRGDQVAAIRDFRHAPYAVEGADIRTPSTASAERCAAPPDGSARR